MMMPDEVNFEEFTFYFEVFTSESFEIPIMYKYTRQAANCEYRGHKKITTSSCIRALYPGRRVCSKSYYVLQETVGAASRSVASRMQFGAPVSGGGMRPTAFAQMALGAIQRPWVVVQL